jgi:hypothetical protein
MKNKIKVLFLVCAAFVASGQPLHSQSRPPSAKSVFTFDEVSRMCGLSTDETSLQLASVRAQNDSSFRKGLMSRWKSSHSILRKTTTVPNWREMMSEVENQLDEECTLTCWIHAATGVVEGQLHILQMSNCNIDLDEPAILNEMTPNCTGGLVDDALDHILQSRALAEPGQYPNFDGVRSGIAEYHYLSGSDEIKAALESGPVTAAFTVYQDFVTFFNNPANRTQTYHHSSGSSLGGHAVTIVSYDDNGWLCKNSWGSGWADEGYFRIRYNECGIDSSPENCCVIVGLSSLPKIIPDFHPSLAEALGGAFGDGEKAVLLASCQVDEDATLPSGGTLFIFPGCQISFSTGKRLTLNGCVAAEGTLSNPIVFTSTLTSPNPGAWYGITLNSGPNSLEYCTIEYASNGLEVKNTSSNVVDHCTIQNCSTNGIMGMNTSKNATALIVQNSTLLNNGRGIGLNDARVDLNSTTISSNSWQGIIGINASVCYLRYSNIIANGLNGVYFSGANSFLFLGGASDERGYNTIHNNSALSSSYAECRVLGGAWCCVGWLDADLEYWGYNNIYHGANPSNKLVSNSTNNGIMANLTYWGYPSPNGPPASEFDGPVNYGYYFDNLIGLPKLYVPIAATGTDGQNPTLTPKRSRLVSRMMDIVKTDSDSAAHALALLNTIANPAFGNAEVIPGGWVEYLTSVVESSKNSHVKETALEAMFDATVDNDDPSAIIRAADVLIKDAGDELWAFCQMKKLSANLRTGDLKAYENNLSILREKSKDVDVETIAFLEEFLKMNDASSGAGARGSTNRSFAKQDSSLQSFDLGSNFPNPFNPSTSLQYQMPCNANVRLAIFDVLGREIAELVNGNQPAGHYTVRWDASAAATGIYYARFTVTNEIGRVVYSKVNKLLLMK